MSSKKKVIDLTEEEEHVSNIKQWTEEDDDILYNDLEVNKKSYKDISKRLNRTVINIKLRVITEIIYPKCTSYNDIKKYSSKYDIGEELIKRFIINKRMNTNNKFKKIEDTLKELNKKLDKIIYSKK